MHETTFLGRSNYEFGAIEIAGSDKWTAASLAEVAEFFGAGYQTAKDWSSAGMPKRDGGWYLPDVFQWLKSRPRERKAAAESSVANMDEQLKGEQIRKLKLANDLKEGRLVERDVVIQQASELCLRLKTRLESMPDEMEMTFPAETRVENKQDFGHRIWQVLKELAAWTIGDAN